MGRRNWLFKARLNAKHLKRKYDISICFSGSCHIYVMGCLLLLLLICAGDIWTKPCPKKKRFCYNLSLCHWNLYKIAAHDFSILTLSKIYNMNHNFDIICLSKTNLDSLIQHDDERLHLNEYKLARADNPNNNKRWSWYLL